MYIITLRFSDNKAKAKEYMEGHKAWISDGFKDDVFLYVGSLQPNAGGVLLAHNATPEEIQERVNQDPFVIENIVTADILETTPGRTDSRLEFLTAKAA
ncbi:MAG: hypothetical protein PVF65_00215 [Sphingomonadales bacterium]|jgi:uncharacterized protein YciI